MKLLSLPLMICSLVFVSACSDSNTSSEDTSDNDTGEQMEMNGGDNDIDDNDNDDMDFVPADTTANYRITFNGSWSASTHTTLFPAGAHFSGLVGAVHNDQVTFWEAGQIATDGIELMAETGAKSLFLDEIASAISAGYAQSAIDGPGIASSPGSASVEVTVSVDNPLVTLTTMLAPSPDWFTGFHSVRLYEGDSFVQSLTIEGVVYDSGTDSGLRYTSSNSDTQPRDIISRTSSDPADSPFIQGLPIAGQFVIERL